MLDTPGIYDLTDEEYFADPCPLPSLTAGIAKTLLQGTPMHAADEHPKLALPDMPPKEEEEDAGRFDIGKSSHALLTGKGAEIYEVDAKSWSTKAAKEARDAGRAAGMTPLLIEQADRVRRMVELAKSQLIEGVGYNPFDNPENNELTMIWKDAEVWCRAKADCLDLDHRICWDFKSTMGYADPQPWASAQDRSNMIAMRAAHYLHGLHKLIGPGWRYRFVVQETKRPFCLSVVELPAVWLLTGEDQRATATKHWDHCLRTGKWKGWMKGVVVVDEPSWNEPNWTERRDNRPTEAALELSRQSQAPHK